MSSLSIYPLSAPEQPLLRTLRAEDIAAELAKIGVSFERWTPRAPLPRDADDDAVRAAYAEDIARIGAANGYASIDVVRLFPDNPQRDELRAKFLAEHTHDDDEARFFAEGRGAFYLHVDARVFAVLCEAGDFIRVPKNTLHWFDMGPQPHFTAIRWFTRADGWVAQFTGSPYSELFPRFERLAESAL